MRRLKKNLQMRKNKMKKKILMINLKRKEKVQQKLLLQKRFKNYLLIILSGKCIFTLQGKQPAEKKAPAGKAPPTKGKKKAKNESDDDEDEDNDDSEDDKPKGKGGVAKKGAATKKGKKDEDDVAGIDGNLIKLKQ